MSCFQYFVSKQTNKQTNAIRGKEALGTRKKVCVLQYFLLPVFVLIVLHCTQYIISAGIYRQLLCCETFVVVLSKQATQTTYLLSQLFLQLKEKCSFTCLYFSAKPILGENQAARATIFLTWTV